MIKIKEFLNAVGACRKGRKLMKSAGSFRRAWERAGHEDLSYVIWEVSYVVKVSSTSSKLANLAKKVDDKLGVIENDQWNKENELAELLNVSAFTSSFRKRPEAKALSKKTADRIRAEISFDDLMVLAKEFVAIDKKERCGIY